MKTTLRKFKVAWPLMILLLLPALMRAETAVQAWAQSYRCGQYSGQEKASAMVVDSSNNVIVTGYSAGGGSGSDYATIKFSSAGVPLWTNRYDLANRMDLANAVAVDSSNNVIVTGYSDRFGSGPDNPNGDYATIKYSSAGMPLWTNRYGDAGNGTSFYSGYDSGHAVAVDGSDNVIVTGGSSNGNNTDYATIKYSSSGVPIWTNRYNGLSNWGDATAWAMAVDSSNDVIVTGNSQAHYATIKYSSAGVPLWTNRYSWPGGGSTSALAVAVDRSNDVIVTGSSSGSGSAEDYATIKYSSAGVPLWTNCYNGPGNGTDIAYAVAVDGSNDVIVTGLSTGSGSARDYATIKYSSGGVPLWTNRYNGTGNGDDGASAVAVDSSNNVIVTGHSDNGTNYDCTTIKYSSVGVLLWITRYNGAGYPCAVAVDRTGNVIVTGSDDYTTIKYVFPLMITDFKLTDGTFRMSLDNLQPNPIVIEASTDLAGWVPVYTNTAPTNVLFYTDPDASNSPKRFHRAFQSP